MILIERKLEMIVYWSCFIKMADVGYIHGEIT